MYAPNYQATGYRYAPEPPDPEVTYGEWMWHRLYGSYRDRLIARTARRFGWTWQRTRDEFIDNWNERTP